MKTVILFLTLLVFSVPVSTAPTAYCASTYGAYVGCASCVGTWAGAPCDKCRPGYKLNADATVTCSLCVSGGSIDENTIPAYAACPVVCSGGCQTCGATPNQCTTCKANYYMSAV